MRVAGFLLLLAGWFLLVTAVALLPEGGSRAAFVAAGIGVEMLGLVLAARSYMTPKHEGR